MTKRIADATAINETAMLAPGPSSRAFAVAASTRRGAGAGVIAGAAAHRSRGTAPCLHCRGGRHGCSPFQRLDLFLDIAQKESDLLNLWRQGLSGNLLHRKAVRPFQESAK